MSLFCLKGFTAFIWDGRKIQLNKRKVEVMFLTWLAIWQDTRKAHEQIQRQERVGEKVGKPFSSWLWILTITVTSFCLFFRGCCSFHPSSIVPVDSPRIKGLGCLKQQSLFVLQPAYLVACAQLWPHSLWLVMVMATVSNNPFIRPPAHLSDCPSNCISTF